MIDAAGLRVMRAIAEEGSFTAAALALGYSQPAVSQMVKRLEQRTGTVLVEKVGRSVRLTEAGAVLARHATPVLAALDAAEEEVAAIAGLRSGRVRLMAFPSSSVTLVPRALAAVRAEHPDIALITEDVVGTGRVEMMYMLAEQAVSITMHRFGNHSQSMQRVVDEMVR